MKKLILIILLLLLAAPCFAETKVISPKTEKPPGITGKAYNPDAVFAQNEGFVIQRLYKSSQVHFRVVLETNKPRNVRCALLNSDGDPLAVSPPRTINPPYDDIIIHARGFMSQVESVSCWED